MARSVVGLDIGSAAVSGTEVRLGGSAAGRGSRVRRSGSVALPPGAVEAGLVRDRAAVVSALRQLWAEQHFGTRQVHLGVGSASVLVRQLDLDWMPDDDLRRSLRFQVADLLPVPVDDANIDHVPLGEAQGVDDQGAPRRLSRILLVATAREAVDGLVRAVEAAKLVPLTADLSAFAAVRAVASTPVHPDGPDGPGGSGVPEAVVDVGAQTVSVAVHVDGRPWFVRVASGLGGEMLTRVLMEQTGRSRDEAEALKRTPGTLPEVGRSARSLEESVLLEGVGRLLAEVRTTLDFHSGHDPATAPRRVVLTGGGSLLPGLVEHGRAAWGLPVRLHDDAASPAGAVALGLGLEGAA
ncbi:pilus assembly protein PilM [Nocardioides sp. 31GB23]|uniref:pilus assembly protein PilM n=1 Tax=Nocardioides sp. 31GB23 TaxID=3156065 RepID=UPI0032AE9A3C